MINAQQTALSAELKNDPLVIGYAPHLTPYDEAGLLTLLNAPNYTQVGSVTPSQFLAWSASTGVRATLEDVAASRVITNPPLTAAQVAVLRPSALALLDTIRSGISLDLGPSATGQGNVGMLNAWVGQGAITAAQEKALISLATTPASRVQVLGIGPVAGVDVRSTVFSATGVKVI